MLRSRVEHYPRALYLDAPILLLDEPSSALDADSEKQLLSLLQDLRKEGHTIVVAAHTPAVQAIADIVATLAYGKLVSVEIRVDRASDRAIKPLSAQGENAELGQVPVPTGNSSPAAAWTARARNLTFI